MSGESLCKPPVSRKILDRGLVEELDVDGSRGRVRFRVKRVLNRLKHRAVRAQGAQCEPEMFGLVEGNARSHDLDKDEIDGYGLGVWYGA